jgi:hypothetical protein
LNYFHFDNLGNTLSQVSQFETNVSGVCIGCNKGRVYVVAIKDQTFKYMKELTENLNTLKVLINVYFH